MLVQERYQRVLTGMKEAHIDQLFITDPLSVFWLTGKMVHPGERFYALIISLNEAPKLLLNRLFYFEEEIGVEKVYIDDTDDLKTILTAYVHGESIGIDKKMVAKFMFVFLDMNIAHLVNGSTIIDTARAQKSADEIELMRKASLINDEAILRFKALIHPNVTEKEVADQTLSIYQELGASDFSFPPIVSFGANAADPHHMPDDTVLKEGDVVLFDVGCVYQGYCSDMTRTYFYRKDPSVEERTVYDLVRRANEEAIKICGPDVVLSSIDDMARSIITTGGYGPYFNHRLGHFIGLEDHEEGDVSATNINKTMVGNIFSIEPGIYLPNRFGVRIEDLILITADGYENLNHVSKELEVIE